VRARKPDLILADVMMPGLDGFGLLREIRADHQLSEIPFILLSARAGEEARVEGLQAGADDYLTKPFSSRELLGLVESHLKLSHLRQETMEALRQADRNARFLASIVESSDDAIISKDLNGVITSWNRSAERMFEYTAAEAVGQSITMLIPPERLDEESRILASLRSGERVDHFETVRVRKDGAQLNISLTISPIKDNQGRIVGASKVARDITDRVRQEAALKRANADLQQFAYSASHDLQEPLRSLTAYSQLLEKDFGQKLGDLGKEFIRYIIEASVGMQNLLRDLRIYTQVSATDHEPVEEIDAGEIVEKALQNLGVAIKESGASISFAGLPRVRIRAFQLEQVFQNLIGNAIRYRSSASPCVQIAAAMQSKEWVFSVKDNGIGIAGEFHEQIFDSFKRLHGRSEYPGTGMGLAICQRSIERSGGRIWVESEPGKGSTFFFAIPVANAPES
jgi:PAS domain S-box-containing protein